jgi:HSP20 family protein
MVRFDNRPAVNPFKGLFDTLFHELDETVRQQAKPVAGRFQPPANVVETNEAYHLELMVPGRRKDGFKLQVEQDLLTISYDQPQPEADVEFKRIRQEFTTAGFSRSFSLNDKVDTTAIQARYEDGLLKVLLPKKAEIKPSATHIVVQ